MKKRYLLWILPLFLFTACSEDDDTIFGESSTSRIRKVMAECADVVMQPEYGWKMLFIPDPNQFGGYNVLMKFETGENVRIFTDFLTGETVSTYSFNASQGAVLSFDSQSALHYLADPANPPTGTGLRGEFEFIIQSISADSLVFTGKKYGNRIVFYPAEEEDWEVRMDLYRNNIEHLTPSSGAPYFRGLTMNQTAVNLSYSPDSRSINYTYADEKTKQVFTGRAGVYGTEDGVRFSPKIRVNGVVLDELRYNSSLRLFEANTPGVIGQLKYTHQPPFPFYGSIEMLKANSNIAGLPKIALSGNILESISQILYSVLVLRSSMSEELQSNYSSFVLAGMKQFRLCWSLEYDGKMDGPWLSYFGSTGLDLGLGDLLGTGSGSGDLSVDYTVDYRLEMTELREAGDQFVLKSAGGFRTTSAEFKANMEGCAGFNAFFDFFTDPAGFTVVPESNRVFVLVNLGDSRRWIKLTKE